MEEIGAKLIPNGTTQDLVHLGRTDKGVFVLSLVGNPKINPENRWTLDFTVAVHKAFDAVEDELANDKKGTAASLLAISESPKFFSNGIDPTYVTNPPEDVDLVYWNLLAMPAFCRAILLPIPTVCAINGHAFGGGFMFACSFDYRLQRSDKGYIAANEIQIGIRTPGPEFTLFRHAMPLDMFQQSMLTGKRWTASEALQGGFVQEIIPGDQLLSMAMKKASELSKLGIKRNVMKYYKTQLKGYVAQEILEFTFQGKKERKSAVPLPGGLQKHVDELVHSRNPFVNTWGRRYQDLEYFRNIVHKM